MNETEWKSGHPDLTFDSLPPTGGSTNPSVTAGLPASQVNKKEKERERRKKGTFATPELNTVTTQRKQQKKGNYGRKGLLDSRSRFVAQSVEAGSASS